MYVCMYVCMYTEMHGTITRSNLTDHQEDNSGKVKHVRKYMWTCDIRMRTCKNVWNAFKRLRYACVCARVCEKYVSQTFANVRDTFACVCVCVCVWKIRISDVCKRFKHANSMFECLKACLKRVQTSEIRMQTPNIRNGTGSMVWNVWVKGCMQLKFMCTTTNWDTRMKMYENVRKRMFCMCACIFVWSCVYVYARF
jgi:hypothetical protein